VSGDHLSRIQAGDDLTDLEATVQLPDARVIVVHEGRAWPVVASDAFADVLAVG